MAEQAALRQVVERQAGEVADLREQRARLVAALEAARADGKFLRRDFRLVSINLALVAALAIAGLLPSGWVR